MRGLIEMPDTLIGPTTGPGPYGINISMLDGDIVPSTRSKSTSGISTRKEFSSGSALALPSASHASPPSKLQPSGTSLGSPFCSASAPGRCKMANLVALGRGRSPTLYLAVNALAKVTGQRRLQRRRQVQHSVAGQRWHGRALADERHHRGDRHCRRLQSGPELGGQGQRRLQRRRQIRHRVVARRRSG
jgi:hypothetical protein